MSYSGKLHGMRWERLRSRMDVGRNNPAGGSVDKPGEKLRGSLEDEESTGADATYFS